MENWSKDKEFLETFRAEAEERLQTLTKGLMSLESSPGDEELIKKLFREAHTLKGSAGMMGLDAIKELAHRVEDILDSVQKKQIELTADVTDLLLETMDRIEELLPTGDEEPTPPSDVSELLERLGKVDEGTGKTTIKASSSQKALPKEQKPPVAKAPASQVKETEYSQIQDSPRRAIFCPVSPPSSPKPVSRPAKTATRATKTPPPGRQPPSTKPTAKRPDSTIRVNIERLDKLLNLMGEILVNQVDTEDRVRELALIHSKTRELKSVFTALHDQIEQLSGATDQSKLDSIYRQMNKVEDVFVSAVDELGMAASKLKENTANRRLALDELQDQALHVRMLPLATIFSLYPRVVRDAASTSGKKAVLKISGENTELDKRILEQVADPIMHIIRNCVDHGIEIPTERIRAGKPEEGLVKLSAVQRGDRVEIEVEDDGAGINPEKIKATAVRKGLISADEELSPEDAIELIFRPGFSTAESVTAISGRGVGLDVVKNNIEKLEGSVTVESSPGYGTKFVVSLPVTLAVISGLLVECNQSKFVIPMASVQEIVAVAPQDIKSLGNQRGFLVRGSAVPLVDLLEFLGGEPTVSEKEKAQVVTVGAERYRLGLQVGRLVGEQEIVIKSLGDFLPRLPYIAGVTILGSGEPVLVLNINEIVRKVKEGARSKHRPQPPPANKDSNKKQKKSVLVVEDSLVVRELQRNILETAGYTVETAVDGNDAMMRLKQHPVDCVVTDIEMPGMDGFDLTAAIRRTDELKDIPVVMVTSRSSEEDKRKGADVGANAYVVKGTFDQQNLLDVIERLVA